MSYLLYAAVNPEIHAGDYERTLHSYGFHRPFALGKPADLIRLVPQVDSQYLVGYWNPFSREEQNESALKRLGQLIHTLSAARGAKYVCLCMAWARDPVETQRIIHVDDADIPELLLHMQERCLYQITLYPRHFEKG